MLQWHTPPQKISPAIQASRSTRVACYLIPVFSSVFFIVWFATNGRKYLRGLHGGFWSLFGERESDLIKMVGVISGGRGGTMTSYCHLVLVVVVSCFGESNLPRVCRESCNRCIDRRSELLVVGSSLSMCYVVRSLISEQYPPSQIPLTAYFLARSQ